MSNRDFFTLSALLNYQLSGKPINWPAVLSLMLEGVGQPKNPKLLTTALECLGEAFMEQKRRLGPVSVLHPLRTATLLTTARSGFSDVDILTALFHDWGEEVTDAYMGPKELQENQARFQEVLALTEGDGQSILEKRIDLLTRRNRESYQGYLGRLIDQGKETPEVIHTKLADRLDNSYDLTLDPYRTSIDCYRVMFDALFLQSYRGPRLEDPHPPERKIDGSMRLYQLYKSAIFLSLLRTSRLNLDETGIILFRALAAVSINEAKSILVHIFAYHLDEPAEHRDLVVEVMDFCRNGGLSEVNTKLDHRLDNLFSEFFDQKKEVRKKKLKELYENKRFMAEAALAFIAMFASFLHDESFAVMGISPNGIGVWDE